jgi:DNA-binding HxlR family transcriptional regulator
MATKRMRTRRSTCPTCHALDIFGDKWTLLIVRDLMFKGKSRFGDFLASEERIATNILTERLNRLEYCALIERRPDPTNSRGSVFALTKKGRDLLPLMIEITMWATKYNERCEAPAVLIRRYKADRAALLRDLAASLERAA